MAEQVPPEVQSLAVRYNQLRDFVSTLLQQKMATEAEIEELKRLIDVLENKVEDDYVYEAIGGVLAKRKKDDVLSEAKEKLEILEARLEKFKKQEEKYTAELKETEEKLKALLAKQYQTLAK
ncbi:MAG: prefoldin subunit [Desulfurococcales archaeon]|nr:prefoldin subunit [Desulfurococcales archaeon]MEB3758811.1 prefoldin subunit [Desulfurococcales archaeon]MEB3772825.1 prefoldin subunit [Desulfurococcales archaeon]MEB3786562.1 prefoldin subunit [Desulfurococcales archaeon]MEB3798994.1 prefoldin subunit [Desulfurococcales archaeon]